VRPVSATYVVLQEFFQFQNFYLCSNRAWWYFSNNLTTRQSGYALGVTLMSAGHLSDFRNSFRFPLHLQVTLKTPSGEYHAKTTDISAGGILFHLDTEIEVGSPVEFSIEMPVEILGTSHPVLVMCVGRVVRCSEDGAGRSVGVVIDEYHFKRL
jgi:hypothetical protein